MISYRSAALTVRLRVFSLFRFSISKGVVEALHTGQHQLSVCFSG